MANEKVKSMTNLADSGQDAFVGDWTEFVKTDFYEKGVSKKFLNSAVAEYILGKGVTDMVEDGVYSTTTLELLKTLRVNHPHSEDQENV